MEVSRTAPCVRRQALCVKGAKRKTQNAQHTTLSTGTQTGRQNPDGAKTCSGIVRGKSSERVERKKL